MHVVVFVFKLYVSLLERFPVCVYICIMERLKWPVYGGVYILKCHSTICIHDCFNYAL